MVAADRQLRNDKKGCEEIVQTVEEEEVEACAHAGEALLDGYSCVRTRIRRNDPTQTGQRNSGL